MGHKVTIGGERLGSGRKMQAEISGYTKSTHDLSRVWRSTMAPGTLVPFLKLPVLPGDTIDIDLSNFVMTHPTIGPLFGSYKLQLDVFQVPIRIYQAQLHMNLLDIGMNMSAIKLPQIDMAGPVIDINKPIDNQQVNPSSIWKYLGISGNGQEDATPLNESNRQWNAVPYLGYTEIYKNYYANKQEEQGVVIHRTPIKELITITSAELLDPQQDLTVINIPTWVDYNFTKDSSITINATGINQDTDPSTITLFVRNAAGLPIRRVPITDIWEEVNVYAAPYNRITGNGYKYNTGGPVQVGGVFQFAENVDFDRDLEPRLHKFDLKNIDQMRKDILKAVDDTTAFIIDRNSIEPYGLALEQTDESAHNERTYSQTFNQEGLFVKTYDSDLYNNWIRTEWITGTDSISAITSINTEEGSFTIDEFNMKSKIYAMLNKIAISGGTAADWQKAVYGVDMKGGIETPMYLGGMIQDIVFQEVINTSGSDGQPLGTLAGRGTTGGRSKGGKITVKIEEHSYLIGIASITPKLDYSQGNDWDMNIKNMDQWHKPDLDQIGFQDSTTDQRVWFDTKTDGNDIVLYRSAGKVPAWLNYQTAVNEVKGNFADIRQQQFMVLTRRYEADVTPEGVVRAKDITTYIDPAKFNYVFADTRRDSQNFWVQLGVDITARRKMSAKIMPNL